MSEILATLTAGILVRDKKYLISAGGNTPLDEVLGLMEYHGIVSVPVRCEQSGEFIGIVNTLDIVTYVVSESESLKLPGTDVQVFSSLTVPVKDLLKHEKRNFKVDSVDTPLKDIIQHLSEDHRVLIAMNSTGTREHKLVTQTDVANFLNDFAVQVPELKSIMETAIGELGFINGNHVIRMINTDCTALEGFKRMKEAKITSLPVVDQNSRLVGTLSASDLRGIRETELGVIFKPVMEFLFARNPIHFPLFAKKDETLRKVFTKILTRRQHRTWIVDEELKILGVIALGDLIEKLPLFK